MKASWTLLLLSLAACASGLKLTPVKSTDNKPSNVAVYFKVETSGGEPVGGLTAQQFHIYEDDSLVSEGESKQTILNPEVAASHYTLLLLDMSGSITESGNADKLVEAATAFSDRVEKSQKVAVYTFDGAEDIHQVVPFTEAQNAKSSIKGLATFKSKDPSTNLNGAIIKGLDELERSLSRAEHSLRVGTLVVFTDGTDQAGRVPTDDMKKKVGDSKFYIFTIGLGAEIKEAQLKEIGKDGTAMAQDKEQVGKAFDTIAARIEAATKSFYLLSYCSPKRAGKHKVRIEAVWKDEKGGEQKGSLEQDFDAQGFAPGCDPNTPPNFDVHQGDALKPADAKDKDKDKDHDKKDAPKAPPPAAPPRATGGGGPPKLPPPPPPKGDVFNP